MGRELRMVPAGWKHPKKQEYNYETCEYEDTEFYEPLYYDYNAALDEFRHRIWTHDLRNALEYFGGGPQEDQYMLVDVPIEKRTHFMMYEDTTEGTPISPAFETPEELARWLADTGASAFGRTTATYDQWMSTIKQGWVISAICIPGVGIISGVAANEMFD